jgi:hypothetical protein
VFVIIAITIIHLLQLYNLKSQFLLLLQFERFNLFLNVVKLTLYPRGSHHHSQMGLLLLLLKRIGMGKVNPLWMMVTKTMQQELTV